MKHNLRVTVILLAMFLLTQFIGLAIIQAYNPTSIVEDNGTISLNKNTLPYGLDTPEEDEGTGLASIITAFIFAFALIFLFMKYELKFIIRAWFFFVVTLALAITLNAIFKNYLVSASIIAVILAGILAYFKIFKSNVYIHNITETMIYPGIAAVFVPILTTRTIIVLLILISIYDAWAVWKSGIMQKMAKFQMEEVKIFGGFLLPSASKKVKLEIRNIKEKYKNKKIPKKIQNKKWDVQLAILGGGDVIFPIITSGVYLREFGLTAALFVIGGAFAGLSYLFAITKKGKAYPAMPYITLGIFIGIAIWKFLIY